MIRFCSFEHEKNFFEPEAMTEAEFLNGGRSTIDEADAYVWQFASTREQAIEQHISKHDQWSADSQAGRPTKRTY